MFLTLQQLLGGSACRATTAAVAMRQLTMHLLCSIVEL